jgi:cytochrome oxidase Cu insertion factor (SCO1/SenC/PrrC family)
MPKPRGTPAIVAMLAMLVPAALAAAAPHKPADLEIGKVAPDIQGKDVDGKDLKLSDYRGKVVVLDFWGDW